MQHLRVLSLSREADFICGCCHNSISQIQSAKDEGQQIKPSCL